MITELRTQEVIELCVSLHKEVESLEKIMDRLNVDLSVIKNDIAQLRANYKTHLAVYHADSNLKRSQD